jgi:hypothetical protein
MLEQSHPLISMDGYTHSIKKGTLPACPANEIQRSLLCLKKQCLKKQCLKNPYLKN